MPGLWDRLRQMAVTLSRANSKIGGVRTIESDTGRTFYLGSPKSTVSLRVYEKDRERLAAGKISPDECDGDLVRIEWTFRPQSRAKVGAGRLSPGELVRSSVWARDFMSRAAKIMEETEGMAKPKRVQIEREARVSSLEESARHGAAQYGGVFARLAAARIIAARGDDYARAALTPGEIEAEAAILFREFVADGRLGSASSMPSGWPSRRRQRRGGRRQSARSSTWPCGSQGSRTPQRRWPATLRQGA